MHSNLHPSAARSRFVRLVLVPLLLGAAVVASGCATIYTKRIVFENHPIAVRVVNKVIDEETIEYTISFRNTGRQILSFDYTIADEPGVPHVDRDGPNSGMIENLYPGAEVEVANPTKKMAVWVTLGTVTYGKKTKDEIQAIYQADAPVEAVLPPL